MPPVVDPAKFVVIDDAYPQHADYPAFCAKTTELLIGLPIHHIDELVDVVANEIAAKQSSTAHRLKPHHPRYDGEQQLYGQKRRTETGQTYALYTYLDDSQPYHQAYQKFLKRSFGTEKHDKPFQKTFWHITSSEINGSGRETEFIPVPLTTITNKFEVKNGMLAQGSLGGEPLMIHAEFEQPKSADAVWREVNTLFQKAQQGGDTKEKKRDALKCYWLMSHYCPFMRRSATLARITLAYLEQKGGFSFPPTRLGVDLNIEALMRSESDFVSTAMKAEFFDPSLSSEAVMDWHQRAAMAKQAMSLSKNPVAKTPQLNIAYVKNSKVEADRQRLITSTPEIEEKLGYSFRNKKLLEAALTHDSACTNHQLGGANPCERLRVLGNSAIRMGLATIIYDQPGILDESMATNAIGKFHAQPFMAGIVDGLNLTDHLVAIGDVKLGTRGKSGLLEGIAGAIWVDAPSENEAVKSTIRFIHQHFQIEKAFSSADPSARDGAQVLNIVKHKSGMKVRITHAPREDTPEHARLWQTNLVIYNPDNSILFQLPEPITSATQKAGEAHAIEQALGYLETIDRFSDMVRQGRDSRKGKPPNANSPKSNSPTADDQGTGFY